MSHANRLESIFFAALEQVSETDRSSYLDEACGNDSGLRRRAEQLLRAHARASDFMNEPASDPLLAQMNESFENADGVPEDSWHIGASEIDRFGSERDRENDGVLSILEPSARPGSLGRISHYEVISILGNGGFGTVVKAFDEKLRRNVAIKLLNPVLSASSLSRKRFLSEARAVAAVRHENVIAVYEVGDHPVPYFVMEFVPGRTLQQALNEIGPLGLEEVLSIGLRISSGLAAAHSAGLVHRDVKPSNVLLGQGRGDVKLTDFGLARVVKDASVTQSGFIAGTPLYMSPEQAAGEVVDQRSDMFSLGSVLYTMCAGRPPFRAASTFAVMKLIVDDSPTPIRQEVPNGPEWLFELISELHTKDPARRLITAQQVVDQFSRRSAELGSSEHLIMQQTVLPKHAPKPRRGRFTSARGIAAAGFLVAMLGSLAFSEGAGVTDLSGSIIRFFSPEGTLVIQLDDPELGVKLDGTDVVITGAGVKEIRLKPGDYVLQTTRDGKLVGNELVTVTRNDRRIVRVTREPAPGGDKPSGALEESKRAAKATDAAAWEKATALLPAIERLQAVTRRMQELNPGFNGAVTTNIEHGIVRGLEFNADQVTDLSPLRVLTGLDSLKCTGSDAFPGYLVDGGLATGREEGRVELRAVGKSRLVDLSPLKGLPLTRLNFVNTNVYDLTPLIGMKLVELHCDGTKVHDLSPLRGMPLEIFHCGWTRVTDLTPLKGMRLTSAQFEGSDLADLSPLAGMPITELSLGRGVKDLSPVVGMPLTMLQCGECKVSDLSPLRGMPLQILACDATEVTDISPLRGMKTLKRLQPGKRVSDLSPLQGLELEYVCLGPQVTDLSTLKGMPLNKIDFRTFDAKRDTALLRSFPNLQTINDLPAALFWRNQSP
ncbi:MAG: serine/threonine-protein kinase [Isosphaeraceae bacterium]|nr:serine/threonine-protein kinase [Isosphaeraceae bacterium]